jgi:hypothetical protein
MLDPGTERHHRFHLPASELDIESAIEVCDERGVFARCDRHTPVYTVARIKWMHHRSFLSDCPGTDQPGGGGKPWGDRLGW